MSKHLRFGKLLGMLAIMLTLGFAWSSAQNTSSAKQLLTFGFTTAVNNPAAQLVSDVTGVINQTTRTVTVTVPYQTVVTGLKATFTSSQFSNVYVGINPGVGTLAVSAVSPAVDYTLPVTWTVEAENYSFDNYVVTVNKSSPSTAKDLLTLTGAWTKSWGSACLPNTETGAAGITFTGNAVSVAVPYGTDLTTVPLVFTSSPFSTVKLGLLGPTITSPYVANLTAPIVLAVYPQDPAGAAQTYTLTAVVGAASESDNLLSFTMTGATVAINHLTQTIAATVPFSTAPAALVPVWTISPYAKMYNNNPLLTEICSGATTLGAMTSYVAGPPATAHFWIVAEDPSEVSEYVLTVTNLPVSTACSLTAIDANYSKSDACGGAYTGNAIGTIGTNTVTFNVPYGVSSVTIHGETFSALATTSDPVGTVLDAVNNTIVITAEDGVTTKTYTVTITPGTPSDQKQLLTFGFNWANNNAWGFTWPLASYAGVVDQTLKHVTVTVPYNTDLHNLRAYFTRSEYACVSIAESNLITLTPQVTNVTVNDHSNTLTYVVTAENGTQERYDVVVIKETALTGNDLIGFQLTGLPYCFGGTFNTAGTYTGTNIAVSVKSGTNVAALTASFTVSPGATVTPAAGVINFTNPVTFTVTSQAGVAKTYTVTVTPYAANTEKKLLTYWFDADYNPGIGLEDVVGTVNETAKTVELWLPWDARALITHLKASFTLSTNALMTHSEDTQVLQTSGVSELDFTTPVAYTVWGENCLSVEYFVTVNVIPNTNTGISAFTFLTSGCGCDLVTKIDEYARRIYITLPYTTNITNLAPHSIVVTPGATVVVANTDPVQSWSTAKDWTKGPVTYTVTAPDGVTKANWTVIVTNPACTETDILGWTFTSGQVGSAVIDDEAHTVDIVVAQGTNLHNMSASISLSCGATICCNMGACAGTTIDFSDQLCHTCVITAQDQTVTQDWTICLHMQDIIRPEVTTWSVMAYNCTDSVAVQSNELGYVFIVNESVIDFSALPFPASTYNLSDFTDDGDVEYLLADRMGAYAEVTAINTPVYVSTHGLYSGTYWAFAVDESGNISCVSAQKLYLDICDVDVAELCDLRDQPLVWRYRLTEEVYVTYEENRVGGNWKFVQCDECGILIEDRLGALPSTAYGEGAGLTNLKGMLYDDGITLKFIPVCCYLPTKSSTGNVVTPVELTYEEFYSDCYYYTGAVAYESMLVKIITPMIAFDDYHGHPNWMYDNLDLATINAKGDYDYFIQSVFNSALIGTAIPTVPAYYTGVRTNVDWGAAFGLITPRKAADISLVSGPILTAEPNPAMTEGVVPGYCKTIMITLYNEGATLVVNNQTISGVANISALYLDDAAATDEFHIINPPVVPFSIAPWASQQVRVDFCPTNVGDESTSLIVEYGVGKTLVIPINGKTAVIKAVPYCESFNAPYPGGSVTAYDGWIHPDDNPTYLQNYIGNWVTFDGSVNMNMRPRKKVGGVRQPTTMISPGFVVTGTDPVITWVECAAQVALDGPANSPRNSYISTNGNTWTLVDSYNSGSMPENYLAGQGWRTKTYSLANYVGQTIWWKWEVMSVANDYTYWVLDNVCVQSRVTTPIIVGSPNPAAFGGVQVDATSSLVFSVKNTGISVLKVKKVELVGDATFTLTDPNTYPFEVTAVSGAWAYALGSNADVLNFTVTFSPTDIGVKTAKVVITYGLYSDQTYEIPLSGEGLSCYTAAEAILGRNWAPSQNTWFKYTAEKFQIATFHACDPNQDDNYDVTYQWDLYMKLYANCEGTLIAEHDDINDRTLCPTTRTTPWISYVMDAGETVYIFWPFMFPDATRSHDGFFWHVEASYPTEGDVCQNAIPLTLPVVNHFGSTTLFNDDYNSSPCSPYSNYMDGNDKVYTITLAEEGYLTGNILGAYGSIHVLDACPTEELTKEHCKAFVGGPNGGQFRKKIAAGTYFVIISTWAPPQTVDYLLNMSWESGSAVENDDLTNSLSVYPNPTSGVFTVSISNAEATDMTIELVNISGQVVYRNEVKAAYNINEEIDASQFAKGVYYLKVNDGTDVKVEKVVLQ